MRVTAITGQNLASIPSLLVGPVRQAVAQQGFPESIITDSGDLNTDALMAALVETIEIRTEWTTPVTVSVKGLVEGPSNPLWAALKPTIVLSGAHIGRQVIAPYGEASEDGSGNALFLAVLGAAAFFGTGVLLGMFINQRR